VNEGLHGVLRQTASRPSHRRAGHFVAGGLFEGLQSFADLESRIVALPTQQERGDAFEVFAEAYLATQKLVGAEEVWPADRIPFAVLQACRLPLQDLGADGVYKTWGGHYNAAIAGIRPARCRLSRDGDTGCRWSPAPRGTARAQAANDGVCRSLLRLRTLERNSGLPPTPHQFRLSADSIDTAGSLRLHSDFRLVAAALRHVAGGCSQWQFQTQPTGVNTQQGPTP
jgi:hypothetical protein